MADDYKNIASPAANQKKRSLTPPLLLLVGLVAGGGLATWFMWPVENATTLRAVDPSTAPGQLQNKIIQEPEPTPNNVTSPQANGSEQPLEQPLDFYTVLPQMEVPVITTPETAVGKESKKPATSKNKPSPNQRTSHETPATSKPIPTPVGKYYLQVGSFQNQQAATELQHKIDGLGLKSGIQKVRLMNDGVWYRVQVGPFLDLESSDQAQQVLDQHNIIYTLMKQTLHKQG